MIYAEPFFKIMKSSFFAALSILCTLVSVTANGGDLKPLLVVPDSAVVENDFSEPGKLEKTAWSQRQHTRWEINAEDGVLFGQPSTDEFQASVKHHKGYEPRLSVPLTPAEFAASFSIRFNGGEETAVCPFVEFGHHVCRLKFSGENGLQLLAEGESLIVAEAKDYKPKPGKWIHVLAEMKGEEFVVQFESGPTLYAKRASFAKPVSSGGDGFGVAGTKGGTVEIDNLTLWSIKQEANAGWEKQRALFPTFEPVPTGKKVKAKK